MRNVLCFTLIGILAATSAYAAPMMFQAGVADGFALPSEIASPSSELTATLNAGFGGVQSFDLIAGVNGGAGNTQVAHTFGSLPSGITSATLELRVQAGNNNGVHTDGIILSFVDSVASNFLDDIAYVRTFGFLNRDFGSVITTMQDGLLKPATEWAFGDDFTFSLDLAALPLNGGGTLNLLSQLNSHKFLDVIISDETGVDFMKLTVDAPASNNPT